MLVFKDHFFMLAAMLLEAASISVKGSFQFHSDFLLLIAAMWEWECAIVRKKSKYARNTVS